MITNTITENLDFETYLDQFKNTLKEAFYKRDDISKFSLKRGFPPLVFREIMRHKPLSVSIPKAYGGRGAIVKECLGILSAASYESLPLSLTFGINIALFLEPLAKYGQEDIKKAAFKRFLEEQNMGGLMITEPDYGSDALNMQTFNVKSDNVYHIKGTKHWQGLTGLADFWIMTCRSKKENGGLSRDLDFFVVDVQDPAQNIIVEEYFNNLGLYAIPYGLNKVNIKVPAENKLIPESTGLKMMMDILHRSRLQFAGMGMGFLQRMLDEALQHCRSRFVGGKALFELDQVKYQIAQIQNAFTVCSAMCHNTSKISSIDDNVAANVVEANATKAYVTDLMQQSAQTLVQLFGSTGYKMENIAARGIIDSRPFQIFEGSNEMLYTQISEMVLKKMNRLKESNLYKYLSQYELTKFSVDHFKKLLDFNIDCKMPQRKVIELGRVISRVVSAQQIINIGDKGFRPDLIRDSLKMLQHDVATILGSYFNHTDVQPIEAYSQESDWLSFS